jgi:hypothetical protein
MAYFIPLGSTPYRMLSSALMSGDVCPHAVAVACAAAGAGLVVSALASGASAKAGDAINRLIAIANEEMWVFRRPSNFMRANPIPMIMLLHYFFNRQEYSVIRQTT